MIPRKWHLLLQLTAHLNLLNIFLANAATCTWDNTLGANSKWLQVDGYWRYFYIYEPSNLDDSSPVPLVLELHGYSLCAKWNQYMTGFKQMADANNFILVWPQGTEELDGYSDQKPAWNAGTCCGAPVTANVDDVNFLNKVIDYMVNDYGKDIDTSRIYGTGHSNGCAMIQRYAAERTELAAIACMAYYLLDELCVKCL